MPPMRTFSIDTLGCKVNQYETQQIREYLEQLGLRAARDSEPVDLAVINTCCVTHTASSKSRQYITRAKRDNPDAVVVVCGCLPTVPTDELDTTSNDLEIVTNKDGLAAALLRIVEEKNHAAHVAERALPSLTSFEGQTRAFLKVQDGCDGYCTYCIVSQTRPVLRSKPLEEVLKEAAALVAAGHKEIVLTGVFLGAYGLPTVRRRKWPSPQNGHLPNLLDHLTQTPGLARIRLSSLEPADVTDELLDVFCRHDNIMPHLHLPLQSGSNRILKKMCRQYTAEEFAGRIGLARCRLDRPAITTDIIVGFPGETKADFQQTLDLARQAGFAKIHVFPFSTRKNTPAERLPGHLDPKTIKSRAQTLTNLGQKLAHQFRQQFIGEKANVLIEAEGKTPSGRAERYFTVQIENTPATINKNDIVTTTLTANTREGMSGSVEQAPAGRPSI